MSTSLQLHYHHPPSPRYHLSLKNSKLWSPCIYLLLFPSTQHGRQIPLFKMCLVILFLGEKSCSGFHYLKIQVRDLTLAQPTSAALSPALLPTGWLSVPPMNHTPFYHKGLAHVVSSFWDIFTLLPPKANPQCGQDTLTLSYHYGSFQHNIYWFGLAHQEYGCFLY